MQRLVFALDIRRRALSPAETLAPGRADPHDLQDAVPPPPASAASGPRACVPVPRVHRNPGHKQATAPGRVTGLLRGLDHGFAEDKGALPSHMSVLLRRTDDGAGRGEHLWLTRAANVSEGTGNGRSGTLPNVPFFWLPIPSVQRPIHAHSDPGLPGRGATSGRIADASRVRSGL